MEETFAGLITAVEKVIRPLGFKIESGTVKPELVISGKTADDGELRITITRKVSGSLSGVSNPTTWVDLADSNNPDSPGKGQ